MEFRWVAGLTLWTVLSGPVLVGVHSMMPLKKTRVELRLPAAMMSTTANTVATPRIATPGNGTHADRLVLNRR
ncbi:MAG: hypothetical protein JNM56_27405 [Planctomycetia bacterium]|nr:hypothetical protein [Planctomycetia bacterium]